MIISVLATVFSVVSGAAAMTVAMKSRGRQRVERERARQEELWEFKDEAHRARYEQYQLDRQLKGKGRDSVAAAVAATAPPRPFDPLDPNTDKGWCQACPPNHPTGGLHLASTMKYPPSTTLWLCPECYEDYTNPEGVLNPPKPADPEVTSWEMKDNQAVIITPEEHRQVESVMDKLIPGWFGSGITAIGGAGATLNQALKTAFEVPPASMLSREFTCHMCEGRYVSADPVPLGPVLCQRCVQQARRDDCHLCKRPLLARAFGIYDDRFTCDDCMKSLNAPVPPSGTGPSPQDELAEKRRRKRQSKDKPQPDNLPMWL